MKNNVISHARYYYLCTFYISRLHFHKILAQSYVIYNCDFISRGGAGRASQNGQQRMKQNTKRNPCKGN